MKVNFKVVQHSLLDLGHQAMHSNQEEDIPKLNLLSRKVLLATRSLWLCVYTNCTVHAISISTHSCGLQAHVEADNLLLFLKLTILEKDGSTKVRLLCRTKKVQPVYITMSPCIAKFIIDEVCTQLQSSTRQDGSHNMQCSELHGKGSQNQITIIQGPCNPNFIQ